MPALTLRSKSENLFSTFWKRYPITLYHFIIFISLTRGTSVYPKAVPALQDSIAAVWRMNSPPRSRDWGAVSWCQLDRELGCCVALSAFAKVTEPCPTFFLQQVSSKSRTITVIHDTHPAPVDPECQENMAEKLHFPCRGDWGKQVLEVLDWWPKHESQRPTGLLPRCALRIW